MSKIITSDKYLLTVSAYIHNNVKDLPDYSRKESDYPYSSMRNYLGKNIARKKLVDTNFILNYIDGNDRAKAIKAYNEMVTERRDQGINKKLKEYLDDFNNEKYEYVSYRKVLFRDKKPEDIINLIANRLGITDKNILMHKWKRNSLLFRRITAYALNNFCGLGINEVTKLLKNISCSCCSILSNKGYEALKQNKKLRECIENL